MSHVIQIRDVPDDVHAALKEAAAARGQSLTKYMLEELRRLANQADLVQKNVAVLRRTQARVKGRVDRPTILAAVHGDRSE